MKPREQRGYVVHIPNAVLLGSCAERLAMERRKSVLKAETNGLELVYMVINPCGEFQVFMRLDLRRYYEQVRDGLFNAVLFRGSEMLPYVGALRRVAYPHTPVVNEADAGSPLWDFLHEYALVHEQVDS